MATPISNRILQIYCNSFTKTCFDPGTNSNQSAYSLTKRDNIEIQIALTSTNSINPLNGTYPLSGTEIDLTGCTFKFGVKTLAQYTGESDYTLISQTTNPASSWQNLALGRISILLLPDIAAGSYKCELEITTSTGKKVTVFLVDLTITQDLNIGNEGPPTPAVPTYYTAAETDTQLAELSSLSIYPIQYGFPLQVITVDDGLAFEHDVSVFRLSAFLQVASQGQDVIVRLTKNGNAVGDALTIRAGENTADLTLLAAVSFTTLDTFGAEITQIGNDPFPGQNLRVRIHYQIA